MQHDPLLMIFTGVLTAAVLIQSIVFFLIYKSIRQLTDKMDGLGRDLTKNFEMVSEKVNEGLAVIKGVAQDLKPITEKLADATDIVHARVKEIDGFLAEITGSARLEILRIQETFHDASRRIQETIELLRSGILTPLNEINAISRAIRVAIDVLFRRRRSPSEASGLDEEMFI
jgi:hypothetical protein